MRSRHWKVLAALFCAAQLGTTKLRAIDFSVSNGDFLSNGSWAGGVAPGSSDLAEVSNGGNANIRNGNNIEVNELKVASGSGTTGTLTMTGGNLNVIGAGNGTDDAFIIGDFGNATFDMSGGNISFGPSQGAGDFHIGKHGSSTMNQTGGVFQMGDTLRIAREEGGRGAFNLLGGEFYTGTGVVVARNGGADGSFTIGGTGKFVAGNSLGEGNIDGKTDEGFFSVSNRVGAVSTVVVQDSGVVKTVRFTGRQGTSNITVKNNGQFLVDPTVVDPDTEGTANGRGLWNSFLGGGSNSNGDVGGDGDGSTGNYVVNIQDNGKMIIDAPTPQDASGFEHQGFVLARSNSKATLNVSGQGLFQTFQRLRIGGSGAGADITGFNGGASGGANPEGNGIVNVSQNAQVVADDIHVGASGVGELNVAGNAIVRTEAFDRTTDESGSGTRSYNSIRIGFHAGSSGTVNLSENGRLQSGDDLIIGHYGNGVLNQSGGTAVGAYTVLGDEVDTTGVWNMTGGLFDQAGGDLEIGDAGTGILNQSGGTMYLVDSASVGNRSGKGFYNLSGNATLDITKDDGGDLFIAAGRDGNAGGEGTLTIRGPNVKVLVNDTFVTNRSANANSATLVADITAFTHSPILVRGNVDLNGQDSLVVKTPAAYYPFGNEKFTLIKANADITGMSAFGTGGAGKEGAVIGEFDVFDLSGAVLPAGMTWSLDYLQDEVELSIHSDVFMGDTNGDRIVNLVDFVNLRRNFLSGTTRAQGNFKGTGVTDIVDFSILRAHFNKSAAANAPIPEPTGLGMAGIFAAMIAGKLCSRRSQRARRQSVSMDRR